LTEKNSVPEDSIKSDKMVASGSVSSYPSHERRKLFRKLLVLAGLGITGVLLSQEKTGLIRPVEATNSGDIAFWNGSGNSYDDSFYFNGIVMSAPLVYASPSSSSYGDVRAERIVNVDYAGTNAGSLGAGAGQSGAGLVFGSTVSGIASKQTSGGNQYGLDFYTGASPRMSITSAGDVGIVGNLGVGTSSPARSVHLVGANAVFRMDRNTDSAAFQLVRTNSTFTSVLKTFYVGVNASGSNNGNFFIGDVGTNTSGASTVRLRIDNNGNVGIGSIANTQTSYANILTLPNTASTAGRGLANAWSTYSSARWKTNIQPIQGALAMISRLRGVRFNWRNGGQKDIGLVAEEVGPVVPEVVTYDRNGTDAQSLDYSRLIAILIQGVKEQQKEIEGLREEVAALKRTAQFSSNPER
jgi:Chaperone of endosialidase